MDLYKKYKTDKKLDNEGVFVDYGGGTKFRLARMSRTNQRYQKAMTEVMEQHEIALKRKSLDEDLAEELQIKVFVETILLDWEGVNAPDGQPLEYSKDAAIKLLTDLPDLYSDLQEQASSISHFREMEDAETVKK